MKTDQDELVMLLVDIEGNLIDNAATEQDIKRRRLGSDLEGYINRFHEAYDYFKDEVELWSAETGVGLKLFYKIEGDEDEVDGVKILRDQHTKVYVEFNEKTDKAFFKLQLGNIKPAFNVIKDLDDDIWKFQWRI